MEFNKEDKERLLRAKKRVRLLKLFYIHLAGYIVSMSLMVYNLYIVEGEYKYNIISLNLSVIIVWTVFLIIHGLVVFKEKSIFNKNWEDKKIREYTEQEETETQLWE